MSSPCGQLSLPFQSELTQQKDGQEARKVKLKAPSLVFLAPTLVGSGHSQPLKDLFQREGVRVGKESGSFGFP